MPFLPLFSRLRVLALGRGALLCSGLAIGCEGSEQTLEHAQVESVEQAVKVDRLGQYFDLSFVAAPSFAELQSKYPTATQEQLAKRLAWELGVQGPAQQASGSIVYPTSVAAPAPSTAKIRTSCGVTLIGPSWAITAGHCVDRTANLPQLKLQLYRPTTQLEKSYVKATRLTGTWPLFQSPRLAAEDGYFVDEYACEVVHRCWSSGAGPLACPNSGDDVALLSCSGRPGDKYGFVNIYKPSSTDTLSGREALLHWKHELMSGSGVSAADFEAHYTSYTPGVFEQNYHYFDNQLLPLRSLSYGLDAPPRFLNERDLDAHGCHGTSGSGVFVRGQGAEYLFVAPVASGGAPIGASNLCAEAAAPTDVKSWQNVTGLGVRWPAPDSLLALRKSELNDDCKQRKEPQRDLEGLPFEVAPFQVSTVFSHLQCQVSDFARAGIASPDSSLSPYPERFASVAVGSTVVINDLSVRAGVDYRLGLYSSALAPCAADCGSVNIALQGQTFSSLHAAGQPSTLVTQLFRANADGPLSLSAQTVGMPRALGGLTLIREGHVSSFDAPEERLETVLFALELPAPKAMPMRFTGDGKSGFAALLKRNERMALSRQALAGGQAWSVRMDASSYEGLFCGLLDMRGAPISKQPCQAFMTVDDRAGSQGRFGFFVELASTSTQSAVTVRYIAIASSNARDDDADGVADVLDNCRAKRNPMQGSCDEPEPVDASLPDAEVVTDDAATESDAELTPDAGSTPEEIVPEQVEEEPQLPTEQSEEPIVEGLSIKRQRVVGACAVDPVASTRSSFTMMCAGVLVLLMRRRTRRSERNGK